MIREYAASSLQGVDRLAVEYETLTGEYLTLESIFHCESCQSLLSVNPQTVVEEIDTYYCPTSLENLPSSEATSFHNRSACSFDCPTCGIVLSTHARDDTFVFVCSYCRWCSDEIDIQSTSPTDLISVAFSKEQANLKAGSLVVESLLKEFKKINKPFTSPEMPKMKAWSWENAEAEIEAKGKQYIQVPPINKAQVDFEEFSPQLLHRTPLRTKRSLRCRSCLENDLPNFILKPEIDPLKADSSLKKQHRSWFKKKCLGFDFLPRFSFAEKDDGYQVCVTNPRDSDMHLELNGGEVKISIDAFDELEEPVVAFEQDFVSGAFQNKILVHLPKKETYVIKVLDDQPLEFSIRISRNN